MKENYIQVLGKLAIATRLKQLTELLFRDMVKIYREQQVGFEPRWFSFIHLLNAKGQLSLSEIAAYLNQTHVAANQVANALQKHNLLESSKDEKDSRKRMLQLSKKGKQMVLELEPVWSAVESAVEELMQEADCDLLDDLAKIEIQLMHKSAYSRISNKISVAILNQVEIMNYKPVYKHAFIDLNLEWLEKYFMVEAHDKKLLFSPDEEIVGKGGNIMVAIYHDQVIGTAALLKVSSTICELTKMAVTEKMQSHGIGRKLLENMIILARSKGYKKMTLLTSPKLERAVKLYQSFGFKESHETSLLLNNLERCSIQMEIKLNNS